MSYRLVMRSTLIAAVLVLASCTTPTVDIPTAPGSTSTTQARQISVQVQLPSGVAGLIGDAEGRVLDEQGAVVAEFTFESGWQLPIDYYSDESPVSTGASLAVAVDLPGAAIYIFELDDYFFSRNPCGTCGTGYGPVTISAEVEDGSVVRMPRSDDIVES